MEDKLIDILQSFKNDKSYNELNAVDDILNLFDVRISLLADKWLEKKKYFTDVAENVEKIEHTIRFNAKAQTYRDCWKELNGLLNES